MGNYKKLAYVGKECVACGCCVAVCPRSAIQITAGVCARIEEEKCVGCGKCAKVCPAGAILVQEAAK